MSDRQTALQALAPVLDIVRTIDTADPSAAARLSAALPMGGETLQACDLPARIQRAAGEAPLPAGSAP